MAVGIVGLIALPVAVGFYGVTGGFSASQSPEEAKEPQAETASAKHVTPHKLDDSPDTKASSGQVVTPDKDCNFNPMKGNLYITPLKLQHI